MNKKVTLFFLLLVSLCLPLIAQQDRCKVTGTVQAKNNHDLTYASVYISKQDSVIAGTLTNQKGGFEMEVHQSKDSFLLTVVFMGYKTKQLPFLANTPQVSLDTILMEATSQQLDEVYVTYKNGEGNGRFVDVTTTRLQPTDATQWMGGTVGDVLRPDIFFKDFIPSGFVLLILNGLTQLAAAWLLFKKHRFAPYAVLACGIIMMLWIALEWWL